MRYNSSIKCLLIEFTYPNLICICLSEIPITSVQNNLLNVCLRVVNSQGSFSLQKLVLNVGIKAIIIGGGGNINSGFTVSSNLVTEDNTLAAAMGEQIDR